MKLQYTCRRGSNREFCLLLLNSVTSTPQWIRQPWQRDEKNIVSISRRGTDASPATSVGRLEMATDARSRGVQGHVVRTSIVVAPGGPTVGAAAAPIARPNAVASAQALTADPAPSGSASQQPIDSDDNNPGPGDAPWLQSTPCSGTRGVEELCAQQGVWRDTVPLTARSGHVFAAREDNPCCGTRIFSFQTRNRSSAHTKKINQHITLT
jgi:hypothetical protein